MKVCNRCGEEIATADGDNTCTKCERRPVRKIKIDKQAREDAMRSLGLTKVKGARGGTYWE